MGNTCGSLNKLESAVVTTWTDREIRHGPATCFCYNPCTNDVRIEKMLELKIHECVIVEDERDPSKTQYMYGPCIFRLEHAYQKVGPVRKSPVLDQNDYIIVTDKNGEKRIERGPKVMQLVYGESYSEVKEAVIVNVNEYIVLLDKANHDEPLRHIRGPCKVYPNPYEEVLPERGNIIRKCIEINDSHAIWLKKADGRVVLIEEPQMFMPGVGETIEKHVNKTLLKESEFCIIISPEGENLLKRGCAREAGQRAFFLPPFHQFLIFRMGPRNLEVFHTLPDFIPINFNIRTSDNVQVKVDIRISFQIFDPAQYALKPVDFVTQISHWVQNELLDAFAQQTFRDFLKHYAASARSVTQASQEIFREFGVKILDVQLLAFQCLDHDTQELLDKDIITRVTKQNELLAKEADVEIMRREKEIQMQRMDIQYEQAIKRNQMELKEKELDVSLRMKEVDLQIQEEHKRTELMKIKKGNVVEEGRFEGEAQGRSVEAFLESLPKDLTIDQRVAIWQQLRDLEKAAMVYSKVSAIEMHMPGTELKKFDINVDAGAKKHLDGNPMLLPAILGYTGDQDLAQNNRARVAPADGEERHKRR